MYIVHPRNKIQKQKIGLIVGYVALCAWTNIYAKSTYQFLPWEDLEIELAKHL